MRDLTDLCRLAAKHSTDKGGAHLTYAGEPCEGTHGYTPVYHDLTAARRFDYTSVLEIGINRGCSLRMWAEWFPNATITGFDIRLDTMFQADRIKCGLCNQSSSWEIKRALETAGTAPYDLIIDDGSHIADHQITSLLTLLPFLKPGGHYVVEDATKEFFDTVPSLPDGYEWTVIPTQGVGKCSGVEPLVVVRRTP